MDDNQVDDFDAGFEGSEPTLTETPEVLDQQQQQQTQQEQEPEYAKITKAEYEELLKRTTAIDEIKAETQRHFNEIYGRVGNQKQILERLQQSAMNGIAASPEDFAELSEAYGPDLAELYVKGLNKTLSKVRGGGAINPEQIDSVVQQHLNPTLEKVKLEMRHEIAAEELAETHPNWREIVGAPETWQEGLPNESKTEFRKWLETKPKDEFDKFINSNNPRYIARTIDQFKEAKLAAAQKTNSRQRRIEAAIPVRGVGGHAPSSTDDDEFEAGFNS